MNIRDNDLRVTREAADWLMELQTEGERCHSAFTAWLRRSPEHVEEFLAIAGVSLKLDGIDPQHHIDVQALLNEDVGNVVALTPERSHPSSAHSPKRAPAVWLAAACITAAVLIGVRWWTTQPQTYITGVGEQRAVKLDDGSLIQLNTQSQAQVRFSGAVREVHLLAGEALFTVEREAGRPFRVVSGNTTVEVLGTQFNVYRSPSGHTTVSVMEGAVQLIESTSAAPTRLDAGEQADVRAGAVTKHPLPDAQSVTAWRQRQLIFRDKPLAEVVDEFNRYNSVQIEVDPAAGQEPLSGVFAADRPDSFVRFLEKDKSIQVERRGQHYLVRSNPARP